MAKKTHVSTTVNSEPAEFLCEPRESLLEVLRDTLKLTGAKRFPPRNFLSVFAVSPERKRSTLR